MKTMRGITLIELSIALLVAVLVVGTAVPGYLYLVDKSRTKRTIEEVTDIQRQVNRFKRKNNRYPDTLAEIYPALPQDPWGNAYQYLNIANSPNPGSLNRRMDNNMKPLNVDYDLYSPGGDTVSLSPIGASESRDDIIRADNGDFVGITRDY
jgi:general secretion pathway protein G